MASSIAIWLVTGTTWAAPGETIGASAGAASPSVVDTRDADATVDWTRGMIIARGAAAADMRAPSPRVARVKATRQARRSARARLLRRARSLQIGASQVGARADADAGVKQRLKAAVERVLQLSIDYASDGSVVLTAGLPLEAVRVAVSGPGRVRAAAAAMPTSVVIDATGAKISPALGLAIATPDGPHAGPTVFHRTVKAALADARAGARVLVVVGRAPAIAAERTASGLEPGLEPGLEIDVERAGRRHDLAAGNGAAGAREQGVAPVDQAFAALRAGALLIVVLGDAT